ncbi:MAG: hypothetical protein EU551_01035 [Promethearchaeota archaeon]|nr:MAG: hypothetical protein EU551_01035 [Candidatus Lokiarchaeota archaeon]
MKQSKLFIKREKERKEKELKEKKYNEAVERKNDYRKRVKNRGVENLKPKNEYFVCECGLRLHWKVAWARKDGCPQCNRKFKKKDIFIIPEEI